MLFEVEVIYPGDKQEEYLIRDRNGSIRHKLQPVLVRQPRLINSDLIVEVIPNSIVRLSEDVIPINTIKFLNGTTVDVTNSFKYLMR